MPSCLIIPLFICSERRRLFQLMWKKLRQKLDLPESYISITLGFLVVLVAGILTYNYFVKNEVQNSAEEQKKAAEEQKAAGKPVLPTTYSVSSGDTLWSIAEKHYGSGYNWVTLATANNLTNPDQLEEGQKLSVPKAEVIKPESNILATTAPPKDYSIAQGDSLWKIAEREYGSGYEWTKIAEYNSIANPDLIFAGNVIKLPR